MGDVLPRLSRFAEIERLVLVQCGEPLFERNFFLEIAFLSRLALEKSGEVVPALRLLERARQ